MGISLVVLRRQRAAEKEWDKFMEQLAEENWIKFDLKML